MFIQNETPTISQISTDFFLILTKKAKSEPAIEPSVILLRHKRQFGGGGGQFGGGQYGQSSALANANAFNQYSGPNGFGGSSALAGAQSFQSQGPLGGFGASAANSASQGFQAGPGGITGNAGFSGSQTYNLPNNHHVNVAYGGTQGFANGQSTGGNSHSVNYDK